MKGFVNFIITIIVLLIAGGTIIYFGLYKADNRSETVAESFYVSAPDGTEIKETYSMSVSPLQVYEFTVKGNVSVLILPNNSDENNDFQFKHNGSKKQFFAEMNLSKAFNVERNGNVLKVSVKDVCDSVKAVFEKIYDGETIELPSDVENSVKPLFMLVIKEEGTILYKTVYFGIGKIVSGVNLPPKIIF